MDPGLIAAAKKAVASKPRKHVTPAILLAVVKQESGGVPYFVDVKPGSLYALNTAAACMYYKHNRDGTKTGPFFTGFKTGDIKKLITIPEEIAGWKVPKEMAGQLAKFRFEYGYWEANPTMRLEDRFYYSSSWGLVQFMGPNISREKNIDYIRRFAADIPLQLLYGAGMLDGLLERAAHRPQPKDDPPATALNRAYRAYNSGNLDSPRADVIARAHHVEKCHAEIQAIIGG